MPFLPYNSFEYFFRFNSIFFSSYSFGFAEDDALEAQVFNQKLFWIEQKIDAIQETQKQITEKQARIKEELDSLRILINRFR